MAHRVYREYCIARCGLIRSGIWKEDVFILLERTCANYLVRRVGEIDKMRGIASSSLLISYLSMYYPGSIYEAKEGAN